MYFMKLSGVSMALTLLCATPVCAGDHHALHEEASQLFADSSSSPHLAALSSDEMDETHGALSYRGVVLAAMLASGASLAYIYRNLPEGHTVSNTELISDFAKLTAAYTVPIVGTVATAKAVHSLANYCRGGYRGGLSASIVNAYNAINVLRAHQGQQPQIGANGNQGQGQGQGQGPNQPL